MLAGDLYDASDSEIQSDLAATRQWLVRYNASLGRSDEERRGLLAERFKGVGQNASIRPPFHCDYGFNITLGEDAFLNFNCVILDVVEVLIGAKTQIASGVQILAADHPRSPDVRASGLEFGRPIHIGVNVWVGGGAIILPGVYRLEITRSSVPEASLHAMCRPVPPSWETPLARVRHHDSAGTSLRATQLRWPPFTLDVCRRQLLR